MFPVKWKASACRNIDVTADRPGQITVEGSGQGVKAAACSAVSRVPVSSAAGKAAHRSRYSSIAQPRDSGAPYQTASSDMGDSR